MAQSLFPHSLNHLCLNLHLKLLQRTHPKHWYPPLFTDKFQKILVVSPLLTPKQCPHSHQQETSFYTLPPVWHKLEKKKSLSKLQTALSFCSWCTIVCGDKEFRK